MGHYKSNLRDIEFNLFEVLGRDKRARHRPVRRDGRRHRPRASSPRSTASRATSSPSPSPTPTATRRSSTRRPTPRRCRSPSRRRYEAFMDAEYWRLEPARGDRRHRRARAPCIWAFAELVLGANPAVWMYSSGPAFAGIALRARHRAREEDRQAHGRQAAGAPPWCSPSPTPAPTSAPAAPRPSRRTTAPGTSRASSASSPRASTTSSENIIHLVLARPEGVEARRPRHQGPVAVRRPEVPLRLRDRRAAASATASTPPTSSTRWASRSPTPAR